MNEDYLVLGVMVVMASLNKAKRFKEKVRWLNHGMLYMERSMVVGVWLAQTLVLGVAKRIIDFIHVQMLQRKVKEVVHKGKLDWVVKFNQGFLKVVPCATIGFMFYMLGKKWRRLPMW